MKLTNELKMYKLTKQNSLEKTPWPDKFLDYQCSVFSPNLFNLGKYGSNFLINFLWYLFTSGKFEIVFLFDNSSLVHYSYITPKTFRFPFMAKNDIMIGPCFTSSNYRGKGIYTEVLRLINKHYVEKSIWICATPNNSTSLKAFKSSGYTYYSNAIISRLSKIVKLTN